jgi:hypothetical protein
LLHRFCFASHLLASRTKKLKTYPINVSLSRREYQRKISPLHLFLCKTNWCLCSFSLLVLALVIACLAKDFRWASGSAGGGWSTGVGWQKLWYWIAGAGEDGWWLGLGGKLINMSVFSWVWFFFSDMDCK